MEIFPQRNLPPRAEAWGRAIEGGIVSLEKTSQQVSQRGENWGRGSAGRLAVLSRNIEEVVDRSSESIVLSNISVTGSAVAEPFPRVDQPVTFSPSNQDRRALVTLTGTVSENPILGARMYIYLFFNGQIVGMEQTQPFSPSSTPVEWSNNSSIIVTGMISTLGGIPPEITIRAVRWSDPFFTGTTTLTLQEPILTLTRSGVV